MDDLESITQLRMIIADVNVAEISANIQQPIGTWREARVSPAWVDSWQRAAERALDEIEREVADRYMELPLDADGVPIRVGDTMAWRDGTRHTVTAVAPNAFTWEEDDGQHMSVPAHLWYHAKPRTLEDVLEEFASKVLSSGHQWGLDAEKTVEDYADEIRELLFEEMS